MQVKICGAKVKKWFKKRLQIHTPLVTKLVDINYIVIN